jgi:DNA-binding NarL/FixJ family response regulator
MAAQIVPVYNWAVMQANPAENAIKIVLIDDHYLIHESVEHKLAGKAEFQLVATGTAGEQLEPLIEQHHPDVVLLDLGIPTKVGTSIRQGGRYQVLPAVRRLQQKYPATQFVILSAEADKSLIEGALEVGAKGYLLKDDELSVNLLDAIRAVKKGGMYFSSEVSQQIFSKKPPRPQSGVVLSERQLQVLLAIVANANLSYADHAKHMGISEDTFRNHIRAIFDKLGASNLAFAIIRAIQLGIVPAHLLGATGSSIDKSPKEGNS